VLLLVGGGGLHELEGFIYGFGDLLCHDWVSHAFSLGQGLPFVVPFGVLQRCFIRFCHLMVSDQV
jgi:hypothetical protein